MKSVSTKLALASLLAALGFACSSTKTASYHYAQAQIEHADLNFEDHIRVDEYINAFPQNTLSEPETGRDLSLSVEYFHTAAPKEVRTELVQIAIKSRKASPKEKTQSFGLCVALDVSGSMNFDFKLSDSLQALKDIVTGLTDGTEFSLVVFSSDARVAVAPIVISRATKSEVIQKIGSVSAAGGTEVKAGLIEAYRQIATFKSALSRLVLITDGQSEASQLTPETLATQARVSPIQGSRISVIGIGHDVEERSLRSIAEHGKGAYYFAENAKALTRFILDDARSFINPVAESAELTLSTANGFAIRRIYGYEKSQASGGETHIPLHDINVDDWRVIVAEVEKTDPSPGQFEPVTASISYVPFGKKGSSRISKSGRISWAAPGEKTEINPRTARNAVILADAMALVKVSQLSKVSSYQEASGILATQIANVRAARALGDSRSMAKEEAALLRTKRIVDARAGEQALKVADQPEIAPDREAAKVLLRDALQVIGRVTPGPWSLILSLFGAAL